MHRLTLSPFGDIRFAGAADADKRQHAFATNAPPVAYVRKLWPVLPVAGPQQGMDEVRYTGETIFCHG
jgi:hypothetical protein